MIAPSDTESEEYGFLLDLTFIREWVGDRQIQRMKEAGFVIKNKDFEGTIGVLANKINDRKLASYQIPAKQLGNAARKFPNKLVFPLLKKGHETIGLDGQYFFDANHPTQMHDGSTLLHSNKIDGDGEAWYLVDTTQEVKPIVYQDREAFKFAQQTDATDESVFMRKEFLFGVEGRCNVGYGMWQTVLRSTEPLTAESVAKAQAQMMAYKAGNGDPIGIMPNVLLVPSALAMAGRKVCEASVLDNSTNVMKGALKLTVSLWLG